MQALMLAAGMGRRLGKYTDNQTKCMVKVAGRTLIEHTAEALKKANVSKLVMVVGYEAEKLVRFINENISGIEIEFVYNRDYEKTNNIYSLYLARKQLAEDDTILVESDLIYEPDLINKVMEFPYDNVVVVSPYEHWMDGTVTLLSDDGTVREFIEKKDFKFSNVGNYYKTANIYKFSKEFSENQYIPFLEAYIKAYGQNQYYELVLKALAHLSNANLKAYIAKDIKWYEIDDVQDLEIANTMFAAEDEKLLSYERHFGGYWRFTGLKDFCYLVNPYFPPEKMLNQMKYFFDPLLRDYPSGMSIQKLLASKMFQVDERYILAGNGAAELINTLGQVIEGRTALSIPAFNEYIRCFRKCAVSKVYTKKNDFQFNKERLIDLSDTCDAVFLINPDNPSGALLKKEDLFEILDAYKKKNRICVVDESFIDFARKADRYTLISDEILERYPNLVVIKSISKSYGVPGIRLGVLATSNTELIDELRYLLPVWNINSYAEYFMQIYSLYSSEYERACDRIAEQRDILTEKLSGISYIKPYPSAANYIMCKVTGSYSSKELATILLNRYNLLIKDLSEKEGFEGGNYIRLAVKNEEENELLYQALLKLDK